MFQLPFKRTLLLSILGAALSFSLAAAPPYHPYKNQNNTSSVVNDLRHEVDNHEAELRMYEERLNTQENILDAFRQDLLEDSAKNQELAKGDSASLETRIVASELAVSGLISDIRQLQTHANDSAKTLLQYKQKIGELEKQIDHLQTAMNSIIDVLQPNSGSSSAQVYEVQSGDSLEKIARKYKTTIRKLKEINSLKSDRIYSGQKLKLP